MTELFCLVQSVKWLTELVWRYNLFPLDRLVMCMVRLLLVAVVISLIVPAPACRS